MFVDEASPSQQDIPTIQLQSAPEHANHPLYLRIFTVWSKIADKTALSLGDFFPPPNSTGHPNYDQLVEIVGDAHYDRSDFGRWVFEQAAELLAEVRPTSSMADNNAWSHAASHLLRGSAFHPNPHRSLLDHPEARSVAEKLFSRAVEFCEHSGSLGTTAVSLRGVIASNVREWARTGDIESFYFHPSCLQSNRFRELLREATEHEAQSADQLRAATTLSTARATSERFSLSQTPAEFLEWALSEKGALPLRHLAAPLGTILRVHSTPTDGHPPLPRITEDPPPPSASPIRSFKAGIFIDVFGTLIQDGVPNVPLVRLVQALLSQTPPRQVFFVSDSDPDDIERALSTLPRPLPQILAKTSLEAFELECLIDNDEPDSQGICARRYLTPAQAVQQAGTILNEQMDTGASCNG